VKRREFLKTGTVLTAGAVTAPWWWQACQSRVTAKGSVQNMEELFAVSKADMRRLLGHALSNGGDAADLFFEYRVSSSMKMEEEIIKDVNYGISMGLGIRVIKGDQVGYAYTDQIELEKMKAAALTAAHIAHAPGKVQIAGERAVSKQNLYPLEQLSVDEDLSTKLALLERGNQAARAYDNKITKVSLRLADEMKQIMFMDSEGRFFTDVQPMAILRISTVAEKGDLRQGGYSAGGGRFGLEYYARRESNPEAIARDSARIAVTNLEARPAPSGGQIVILGAAESGVLLHEAVGHGLEADFNRKGLANYSGKVGQKVASDRCTIIDSGTYPNLRGSINVDDEGTPPTESVLIENGILRGYMHDRMSARIMNCQPTGNGRRQSYAYPPIPRMTNTYMRGGEHTPEEIIASVKSGVYAKRFGGGQVDITKGDFTFGVYEAYLVENGKITAPLKDVTLIGNGPDVMRKVTMVGNDPTFSYGSWTCGKDGQRVPVSLGIPTTKVSEITVGGTNA